MNRWVVMKFGGTSVSSRERWRFIANLVAQRLDEGFRVVVVHSAIAGVSNELERVALDPSRWPVEGVLESIEAVHDNLAHELGLVAEELIGDLYVELRQLATGISLVGEAGPRAHARLLSLGELMSTRLGAAFLERELSGADWLDVRSVMESVSVKNASEASRFLSAQCGFELDEEVALTISGMARVVVTQGFIARNRRGETVILGRGGSDTSAAYLGAKLGAVRVEVWTDVPGMFSADPRLVSDARLLRHLGYDEAQEIASTGANVLHPRSIAPLRNAGIPMWILSTTRPELPGTVIEDVVPQTPQVKAVCVKKGIVLVSMETLGMWQQVGFLADAFEKFKANGLSIDLVSTSETEVTVTLDPEGNVLSEAALSALEDDLLPICRIRILRGCATVSLVGRQIRSILPRLGPALELFGEHRMHLVTQAASDLNLSFVIDEGDAERLARDLHGLLIRQDGNVFGPTWQELQKEVWQEPESRSPWWETKRRELLEIAGSGSPRYVYDRESLEGAARRMSGLTSIDKVFYAMKANPHSEVLRRFESMGLGFECVSPGEIERVVSLFPEIDRTRILFTPNFAPRAEYERALDEGVHVTLDDLFPLREWPEVFEKRDVFVRMDLGHGRGHHIHVRTAGEQSKFGVPVEEVEELRRLAKECGARVVGLHSHAGSGVMTSEGWIETATKLASLARDFEDVRVLDLGGGFGVPDSSHGQEFDLESFDASLSRFKSANKGLQLWLEPGRYLVAGAGVLLVRVTQVKGKGSSRYVGVDTGMNSLIRPALYGAWHEIVNLTRLGEPNDQVVTVVGPICESGDILGSERSMPTPREGDVLLVANAGAYGHAMSSRYNLREPAEEMVI